MFKKTETSLIALAANAGKYQRVTTPWVLAQVAIMQADIRAEKDRRNARRRELRAIRRAEREAAKAGYATFEDEYAATRAADGMDETNVVAFPVANVA